MRMISLLAKSRLRHYKSRTALTMAAIFLASVLLQGILASALGVLDINRQSMVQEGDWHVRLSNLTEEQMETLKHHLEVETLVSGVVAAEVEYGKLNGYLIFGETLKDERADREAEGPDAAKQDTAGQSTGQQGFIAGRLPQTADEISGPAAFFERLGAEPKIGAQVTIPFRADGADGPGEVQERTFTICGLEYSIDVEELGVAETRIAYGAQISEDFVRQILQPEQIRYTATLRLHGEKESGYEGMKERIGELADSLGVSENDRLINQGYLYMTLTPPTDAILIAGFLALLVVSFSMLLIYSIYYVNVISDIQEIGRLKALGASDGQIRGLFLREGMFAGLIAVPAGIFTGTLIPYLALPPIMGWVMQYNVIAMTTLERPDVFSLPLTLLAAAAMFLAIFLAIRKPMRMAAKVSPVAAVRYEEAGEPGKHRRGFRQIDVGRLTLANLSGNRKRTLITLTAMGLSFSLFMGMAGVLSGITPRDLADRRLQGAQFRIQLDYEMEDRVYPENELRHVQMRNLLGEDILSQIGSMDGVARIRKDGALQARVEDAPAGNDLYDGQDSNIAAFSMFRREQTDRFAEELYLGEVDYDAMTAQDGVILTGGEYVCKQYAQAGIGVGDEVRFTLFDGDREIPFIGRIAAFADIGYSSTGQFVVTEDTFAKFGVETDLTTALFIDLEGSQLTPGYAERYEAVKSGLKALVETQERFELISQDEELYLSSMQTAIVRYPCYALLTLIVFISLFSMVNTMVVSIAARKRELGMLQAVGLSERQLTGMLSQESLFYTAGTLVIAFTVGNALGLWLFRWAKESGFMSVSAYHYPLAETVILCAVMAVIQLVITLVVRGRVKKESLIERIRSGE